ncbi:MFS transporter [Acidiferrobacter sp.]
MEKIDSLATAPYDVAHNAPPLATLCMAVLIAQIDTSVVNLAVRPIGRYFHAGIASLQWVVDGYNLVYAILLLTGGLLADLYGRRRVFMVGAAVFAVTSFLSTFAPSLLFLVAARALAGAGAALLLPASLATVRVVWTDPVSRGRALGIWAACNGLAFVVGPALGGFLIGHFGWRSIFLVVAPVAIATLLLAPRALPESSDPKDRHFDAGGQIFGALALAGLVAAAIAWRQTPVAAALIVGAGLALALFLRIERHRGAAALVPLDLMRARLFRGALTATAGMTFGMYGAIFLMPLFWITEGALTPMGAGLALMPMALVFTLVSPLSGALTARFGQRVAAAGGVAVIGCGLLEISLTAHSASLPETEIGLVLAGLGMGFATGPLMGAAVGAVSQARSGTAASLINVARMIGGTLGVAILGAVFTAAGGGSPGLFWALGLGGGVQLCAAAWAQAAMRDRNPPARQVAQRS